jgi:hypothetical protein|tara:strand:+ start:216 stop:530 length:315 start_codon:yes stop_codon:yes gene_type:complete
MSPEESRLLFEAGHITLEQHETNIAAWNALQREALARAAADKTQAFIEKVCGAPMQAKKIMLKEESMNQMVKAQFKDDRFEKKEKIKLSMGLNYAAKGGGLSLD